MMKSITLAVILTLFLAGTILSTGLRSVVDAGQKLKVSKSLTSMPLAFTENQGQWGEQVKFRADAGGATMWFTGDGAFYQFTRRIDGDESPGAPPPAVGSDRLDNRPDSIETMMIKASFTGANPNPRMVGEDELEYKCNYFLGNDPKQWRADVPNYSAVRYEEVYTGIDLKYYGNGHEMEYDFIVSPGADPSQIRIKYEGVESIFTNADGELVVETPWGEVVERRPVVYQLQNDERVSLDARYELMPGNSFGFALGKDYDPTLPLVIDPVLSYSTYLGGSYQDTPGDIAVDASGAAYVSGHTYSTDFPTLNPYQGTYQGGDVSVTKLGSDGISLVYSTYLGGSNDDYGGGIAVDASGAAYITGSTYSTDFPMLNPYQGTYQGGDVFVTKLSSSGNSLVYSTYLGRSSSDQGGASSIAVDASGAAYITGSTGSTDFPTLNPYQGTYQGGLLDAFVTKLSSSGNSLVYSTYLGGNSTDRGYDIAVDASGAAYVTGYTLSTDFPTLNPYQGTNQGVIDVFVTKLSSSGNSLVYSTYIGGSSDDEGYDIAVDISGAAYITGSTLSTDFPTLNPYQGINQGSDDVFVTKLSSSGNSLVYSTYLGGSSDDGGSGIAVDTSGAAYVTGYTESTDFPTLNPYQGTNQGSDDVFVTKLGSSGNSLIYSTYLGGSSWDCGHDIAVDISGAAYITGSTLSTDFPTLNPYQGTNQGSWDVFVTKLDSLGVGVAGPAEGDQPSAFTLSQNYPNPFNPSTTIEFSLPTRSHVEVQVFNILGQRVKVLHEGELAAGTYTVTWVGRDESDRSVATGIYLYRIKTDDFVESKKMVLLK